MDTAGRNNFSIAHGIRPWITFLIPAVCIIMVCISPVPALSEKQPVDEGGLSADCQPCSPEESRAEELKNFYYTQKSALWELVETCTEAGDSARALEGFEKLVDLKVPDDLPEDFKKEILRESLDIFVQMADLAANTMNDDDRAMGYLKKGLERIGEMGTEEISVRSCKIDMLKNLAAIHRKRKAFDKAIELLEEAGKVK